MKEINRFDIKTPLSVPSSKEGLYKDNFLQGSAGSGLFLILEDTIKSPMFLPENYEDIFKLAQQLKYGSILTSLGRISNLIDPQKEISYIIDLNSSFIVGQSNVTFQLNSISPLLRYRENKVAINGICITVDISLLSNMVEIEKQSELVFEAHKEGLVTFIKFASESYTFNDVLKVCSLLGVDIGIVSKQMSIDLEKDTLSDTQPGLIISDNAVTQSEELFNMIDIYIAKGFKGVSLLDNIASRNFDDSKKMVEACNLMLYEAKDSDDAYDHLIS